MCFLPTTRRMMCIKRGVVFAQNKGSRQLQTHNTRSLQNAHRVSGLVVNIMALMGIPIDRASNVTDRAFSRRVRETLVEILAEIKYYKEAQYAKF